MGWDGGDVRRGAAKTEYTPVIKAGIDDGEAIRREMGRCGVFRPR